MAQKSDYETIFINLGSVTTDQDGTTYDANVNAYITTGIGGAALYNNDKYFSATDKEGIYAWGFDSRWWSGVNKYGSYRVRPVLCF